jgi:hypothetical protein
MYENNGGKNKASMGQKPKDATGKRGRFLKKGQRKKKTPMYSGDTLKQLAGGGGGAGTGMSGGSSYR